MLGTIKPEQARAPPLGDAAQATRQGGQRSRGHLKSGRYADAWRGRDSVARTSCPREGLGQLWWRATVTWEGLIQAAITCGQ